jgi:hypothetical protein
VEREPWIGQVVAVPEVEVKLRDNVIFGLQ